MYVPGYFTYFFQNLAYIKTPSPVPCRPRVSEFEYQIHAAPVESMSLQSRACNRTYSDYSCQHGVIHTTGN